tara:strand:- start:152 stop:574 length:423 start_codon:yes stop_codon:yes gene_type:complete
MIKKFNKLTKSYFETVELGLEFSKKISKGDIIALNGNLGSGKTTFVKGVLKGLNYKYDVTSPTYTLINEYYTYYKIIHIDCYREKDLNRWLNIGITDYFDNDCILFIEWYENIKSILPKNINLINFKMISENERLITCNE